MNPSAKNASKHLYRTIEKVRVLSPRVQRIVLPVIQRNGYYAYPENILLAMVHDKNKDTRELSLRRILKARKIEAEHGKCVRLFKIPKINFDATAYYDLIDWQNILITSPPLLFDVTHDDIKRTITQRTSFTLPVELTRIPCHTQAVERTIKLVTTASNKVCGRDGADNKKCICMLCCIRKPCPHAAPHRIQTQLSSRCTAPHRKLNIL